MRKESKRTDRLSARRPAQGSYSTSLSSRFAGVLNYFSSHLIVTAIIYLDYILYLVFIYIFTTVR